MSNTKYVLAKLVTNPTPPFGKSNFALCAGRKSRIKLDDTVATYDGMIALLKEVFNIADSNALRLFLFTEDEESGETSAVLIQAAKTFDDEILFFRDNGSSNTIDLYAEEVASPSMAFAVVTVAAAPDEARAAAAIASDAAPAQPAQPKSGNSKRQKTADEEEPERESPEAGLARIQKLLDKMHVASLKPINSLGSGLGYLLPKGTGGEKDSRPDDRMVLICTSNKLYDGTDIKSRKFVGYEPLITLKLDQIELNQSSLRYQIKSGVCYLSCRYYACQTLGGGAAKAGCPPLFAVNGSNFGKLNCYLQHACGAKCPGFRLVNRDQVKQMNERRFEGAFTVASAMLQRLTRPADADPSEAAEEAAGEAEEAAAGAGETSASSHIDKVAAAAAAGATPSGVVLKVTSVMPVGMGSFNIRVSSEAMVGKPKLFINTTMLSAVTEKEEFDSTIIVLLLDQALAPLSSSSVKVRVLGPSQMAVVYPLTDPSELGETGVDADALGTQLQRWDLGTLTEKPADQLVAYDGLVEPKFDVLVMMDTYGNVSFYVPSQSKLLVFNIGPASGRGAASSRAIEQGTLCEMFEDDGEVATTDTIDVTPLDHGDLGLAPFAALHILDKAVALLAETTTSDLPSFYDDLKSFTSEAAAWRRRRGESKGVVFRALRTE